MFSKKKTNNLNRRDKPNTDSLRANKRTVYSYYNAIPSESRPSSMSEKIINLADKPRPVRRLPTVVALLIILFSFLYSMTLSRTPSVSLADKNTTSLYRNSDEYVEAAKQTLGLKMSYRSKLTVNVHEVEESLLAQFPELDAAVLRLPVLGRKPNLVLALSKPSLLLATPTKSYIIDNDGVAVSEAGSIALEQRQKLTVIKDESGLSIELGKQIMTSDTIVFINAIKAQLSAQNLNVSQLTLPPSANQLDIRLAGISYTIKTDVAGDAKVQIGGYLAVKEDLERQGITPTNYIDVRVEEKVFYK